MSNSSYIYLAAKTYDMRIISIASMLLVPAVALAEVSDKLPSIWLLLLQGILFGAISLFMSLFRWWLGFIGIALAMLMISGTYDLWQEPYLRDAITNEQGIKYFTISITGALLVMIGSLNGMILGFNSGK